MGDVAESPREHQVYQEGALLELSIGKKSWKMTLTPADFGMEQFPSNFEPGRRRLLPDEALQRIDYIEGQARRTVDKFSFSFGSKNSRFKYRWIHISKLGLVLETLKQLKDDYFNAVRDLVVNYDAHKHRMQTEFPEQWPYLRKAYIPQAEILDQYYFEFMPFNMVFPNQLSAVKKFELAQADLAILDREKAQKMTEEELEQARQAHVERLNRMSQEFRVKAETQVEEFVENVVRQLRGKVVDVFRQITGKIKDGKTIIKTNLDTIRSTLLEVRQLDFLGDDAEFHAQLDRVQRLIDSGREFKDDESAIKELDAVLKSTVAQIQKNEAAVIQNAKRAYFGRRLNI